MNDRKDIQEAYDEVFYSDKYKDIDFIGLIADGLSTENYEAFLKDEEVYIIDWKNKRLVNWYKLGHVGRCLRVIGSPMDRDAFVELFEDIVKEYKEWNVEP